MTHLALLLATAALVGAGGSRDLVVGQSAPDLQQTIEMAEPGDRVLIPQGVWSGPIVVDRAITLVGDGGVIDGRSKGSVVTLTAAGAQLEGVRVRRSGYDRAGPDSCVYVTSDAVGAVVRDSLLSDCTFGVWVHQGTSVSLTNNHIIGRSDIQHRSNRGNGIHLFDSNGLQVVGNTVEGCRDGIYVSATEDSLIADNHVNNQRYGVHYMYSWNNTIRGNRADNNRAGFALMSSHHIKVVDNKATQNKAHGILFRDVQYSTIEGNVVEDNGEGLFFFSSLDNEIIGNQIRHNEIGARVWAGTERNVIRGNAFVGNSQQVFYVASTNQTWGDETDGNYWSDYVGWDQDRDGRGDRPYRVDSMTAGLLHRYPAAALLLNSPVLELIGRLQTLTPVLAPPTIVEEAPRTSWRNKP